MKELLIRNDDGTVTEAGLQDVVEWWLGHYEGIEHLTEGGNTSPETWYTVNTILRRCLEKIKERKK